MFQSCRPLKLRLVGRENSRRHYHVALVFFFSGVFASNVNNLLLCRPRLDAIVNLATKRMLAKEGTNIKFQELNDCLVANVELRKAWMMENGIIFRVSTWHHVGTGRLSRPRLSILRARRIRPATQARSVDSHSQLHAL